MKNAKRITFEFSPETVNRLNELKVDLGLVSTVDVMRTAIQILSYLQRERKNGYELILRKEGPGGTREKEPVFAGLSSEMRTENVTTAASVFIDTLNSERVTLSAPTTLATPTTSYEAVALFQQEKIEAS